MKIYYLKFAQIALVAYLLACLVLNNQVQSQIISRCEYVCGSDVRCKSGYCVLTYCIDTPYCFKFCLNCGNRLECQQTGPYCYFLDTSRANTFNTNHLTKHFIIIGSLCFCLIYSNYLRLIF